MTTICITENTTQQNGSAADSVVTGVEECSIRDDGVDTNFSTGYDSARTQTAGGKEHRSIWKFDMSDIPAGSTINSADLYLYLDQIYYTSSTSQLDFHRLKLAFTESQATWNDRATSTAWGTAGAKGTGDIDTTADDSHVIDTSGYSSSYAAYHPAFDVSGVIQAIIDDGTNNGFLIAATKTAWLFYGSNYSDGSRTELLIDYTAPAAAAPANFTQDIILDM